MIETQREDGTWDETLATGTGFPKVFYLSYHLYRDMFPLLALSSFAKVKDVHRNGFERNQLNGTAVSVR